MDEVRNATTMEKLLLCFRRIPDLHVAARAHFRRSGQYRKRNRRQKQQGKMVQGILLRTATILARRATLSGADTGSIAATVEVAIDDSAIHQRGVRWRGHRRVGRSAVFSDEEG
nr:hypothetical protein WS95_13410 [Burkholderia sp. MSMB1826]